MRRLFLLAVFPLVLALGCMTADPGAMDDEMESEAMMEEDTMMEEEPSGGESM